MYSTVVFPQYPQYTVFYSFFQNISTDRIKEVKKQIIAGNLEYDYCYLNIKHIVSTEVLLQAIHKAILNYTNDNMKAKTLNAEIILNLSPINNIMDALKKFGIDENSNETIVVSVLKTEEVNKDKLEKINQQIMEHFEIEAEQNVKLTDDILYKQLDIQKFKKVYKLNDAILSSDENELKSQLNRLAIGACILRGL